METALIRMSPTGFKAFVEELSRPARPVPEMVELFQRAAPLGAEGGKSREVSRGSFRAGATCSLSGRLRAFAVAGDLRDRLYTRQIKC